MNPMKPNMNTKLTHKTPLTRSRRRSPFSRRSCRSRIPRIEAFFHNKLPAHKIGPLMRHMECCFLCLRNYYLCAVIDAWHRGDDDRVADLMKRRVQFLEGLRLPD